MTARTFEDGRIPVRVKLSALWGSMMFLFIWTHLLSFFRPGEIDHIRGGMMGVLAASQATLLVASVFMMLPALMVVLTLCLAPRQSRVANLAAGGFFMLVNLAGLTDAAWAYHLMLGAVASAVTLAIIGYAWKWPSGTTP